MFLGLATIIMYLVGIIFGCVSLANKGQMSVDMFWCALVLMLISFAIAVVTLIFVVRPWIKDQKAYLNYVKMIESLQREVASYKGNKKNEVFHNREIEIQMALDGTEYRERLKAAEDVKKLRKSERSAAWYGGAANGLFGLGAGLSVYGAVEEYNKEVKEYNSQLEGLSELIKANAEDKYNKKYYNFTAKYDDEISYKKSTKELFKKLTLSNVKWELTEDNIFKVHVNWEYGPEENDIDGCLLAKVYDKKDNLINALYLPLPIRGTTYKGDKKNPKIKKDEIVGYHVNPKNVNAARVEIVPVCLWEIKKGVAKVSKEAEGTVENDVVRIPDAENVNKLHSKRKYRLEKHARNWLLIGAVTFLIGFGFILPPRIVNAIQSGDINTRYDNFEISEDVCVDAYDGESQMTLVYKGNGIASAVPGDLNYKNKRIAIVLEEGITELAGDAFGVYGWIFTENLVSITVNGDNTKISYPNYKFKALEELIINGSNCEIEDRSFYECNELRRVEINGNGTTIGKSAFGACQFLRELTLTGASRIEEEAFYNCDSLREVIITKNTTYVGKKVFMECKSTLKIYCEASEAEALNFDSEWNYSYGYLDVTWNYEITNN